MSRKMLLMIVVFVITAAGTGGYLMYGASGTRDPAPVVKQTEMELNDTAKGMIRIKINPRMHIEKGRIRDLKFYSINRDRFMKCKIRLDGAAKEEYIVETPFVAPGEVVESIAVSDWHPKKGISTGTAEMYTYLEKDESTQMGQTNVEISITK